MKCFLCWFIWIQILLEFIQIRYTVQNAIFEAKNMKFFLTWNEDIDVQIKYDDLELHNLWCLKYAVGVLFKIQSSRKNMFAVIRLSSFDPIVSRISLYIIHCTFKDLFRTIEFIDKDIKMNYSKEVTVFKGNVIYIQYLIERMFKWYLILIVRKIPDQMTRLH